MADHGGAQPGFAVAVSLMALAAVLGARWKINVEIAIRRSGPFTSNKWLGVWALVFASVHLVFKAGTPAWEAASILPLPGAVTRLVRQLSFVSLMLIVLLALNRKIPYRTWRWWHKLSGPLFLIVIAGPVSKSPIVLASPAGTWLVLLSLLGVMGQAYKLVLYPLLSAACALSAARGVGQRQCRPSAAAGRPTHSIPCGSVRVRVLRARRPA